MQFLAPFQRRANNRLYLTATKTHTTRTTKRQLRRLIFEKDLIFFFPFLLLHRHHANPGSLRAAPDGCQLKRSYGVCKPQIANDTFLFLYNLSYFGSFPPPSLSCFRPQCVAFGKKEPDQHEIQDKKQLACSCRMLRNKAQKLR